MAINHDREEAIFAAVSEAMDEFRNFLREIHFWLMMNYNPIHTPEWNSRMAISAVKEGWRHTRSVGLI